MATLPKMSLAQIRASVRQRADMVNSQFVTDSELNGYVNESLFSLYDLLVTAYGNDYFVKQESTTTDGTQFLDLPSDFYKLLGVDLMVNGSGQGTFVSLQQFPVAERNRNTFPNTIATPGLLTNLRYRIRAGKLWLTPTPQAGQTIRILYVPRMTALVDPVTVTVNAPQPGDSVAFDPLVSLVATSGSPGTNEFFIGSTDTATAANLADSINNSIDLTDPAYDVFATVSGNVVTILRGASATAFVGVSVSNSLRLALAGSATISPTNPSLEITTEDQSVSDGISGWLEYVIVDSAIKCLQKEESSTTVLERSKAQLVQRINDSATNRDAATPSRVADTSLSGQWYGNTGWGGGWNGGGWWG